MSLYDRILGEERQRAHTVRLVIPAPGSGDRLRTKPLTPTPAEQLPAKRSPEANAALAHLQRHQGTLKTLQGRFHKESDPKLKSLIGIARDKLMKNISGKFNKQS